MVEARAILIAAALLSASTPGAAADYVTIRNQVTVDRPIGQVWGRIGGWCAIADWMKVTCDMPSGTGDVGSVRTLNGTISETMVARAVHSYTYWQTVGTMAAYGYHGTLAAEPAGPRRTTLTYTLLYDRAAMPSDAVRASEHDRLNTRFAGALAAMKQLVEGR